MPSTYTQNYYHAVFSTKKRANLITPEIEPRLYAFMAGILKDLGCTLIAINGMRDHVHLLIRYRPDLSHSEMMQQIKGRSSKWINEEFTNMPHFAWQEGYGGFTVSRSMKDTVERYIKKQKLHHQKQDYRTEFLELLRLHDIDFNMREVFR